MSASGQGAPRAADAAAAQHEDDAAAPETAENVEALIATRMRELEELQAQAAQLQQMRDSVMALLALQEAGALPPLEEGGDEEAAADASSSGDGGQAVDVSRLMQMLAALANMDVGGAEAAPAVAPATSSAPAQLAEEEESLESAQAEVSNLRAMLAERQQQVESLRQQTAMMDMLLANLEAQAGEQDAEVRALGGVVESKDDSAQHQAAPPASAAVAASSLHVAADSAAASQQGSAMQEQQEEEEMTPEDAAELEALTQQLAAAMAEMSALNQQAAQLTQVRDALQSSLEAVKEPHAVAPAPAATAEVEEEGDPAEVLAMLQERESLLQRLHALMALEQMLQSTAGAVDADAGEELERGHVERMDDVEAAPAPAAAASITAVVAPTVPASSTSTAATAVARAADDDDEEDAELSQEQVLEAMQQRLVMLQRLEQLMTLQANLEAALAETQGQATMEQLQNAEAEQPASAAAHSALTAAPSLPAVPVAAASTPVAPTPLPAPKPHTAAPRSAPAPAVPAADLPSMPSTAALAHTMSSASSGPVDVRAFLSAVGFVMEGGELPSGTVPQLRRGTSYDADDDDSSATPMPAITHPSGSTRAARAARTQQDVADVRALPEVTPKPPAVHTVMPLPAAASRPAPLVSASSAPAPVAEADTSADDADLDDLQARVAYMQSLANEVRVLQAQQRALLSNAALHHMSAQQVEPEPDAAATPAAADAANDDEDDADAIDVERVRTRLSALRTFLADFDLQQVLGEVLGSLSRAEDEDAMSIGSSASMPHTLSDLVSEEASAMQRVLAACARRAASLALVECLPELEPALAQAGVSITLRDIASTPTFARVFRNQLAESVFSDIPAAAAILSIEPVPVAAQQQQERAPGPTNADVYAGSLRGIPRPAVTAHVPAPTSAPAPLANVNESFHSTLSAASTRSRPASVQHAAAEYEASMRATRGEMTQRLEMATARHTMSAAAKPRRSTSGTRTALSSTAVSSRTHAAALGNDRNNTLRSKLPPQLPPPAARARSRSRDHNNVGPGFTRASPTPTGRALDARAGVRIVSHGNHAPAPPTRSQQPSAGTVRGSTVAVLPPAEPLPRMEMLPGRGVPAYTSAGSVRNPAVSVEPSVHVRTPPRRSSSRGGQERVRHGTPVWLRSALENATPSTRAHGSRAAAMTPSPPHQQVQPRRASPSRTPGSATSDVKRGRAGEPRWDSSTRVSRSPPPARAYTPGRVVVATQPVVSSVLSARPRVMDVGETQVLSTEQEVDVVAAQILLSRQRLQAVAAAPDTPAPRVTMKHVPTLRVPDGEALESDEARVQSVHARIATARERIAAASVRAPSPRGSGFVQRDSARPELHLAPREGLQLQDDAAVARNVEATIARARERIALVTGDAASSPRGVGFNRGVAALPSSPRPVLSVEAEEESSAVVDDLNAPAAWNSVVRTIERARERIAAATSRMDGGDAFTSPSKHSAPADALKHSSPHKSAAFAAVDASLRALAATSPELSQRIEMARAVLDAPLAASLVSPPVFSVTSSMPARGGQEVQNEPFDYAESVAESAPMQSHDASVLHTQMDTASVDTDAQHVSRMDMDVLGRVTASSSRSGGGTSLAVKSVEGALSPAEYDYEEVVSVRATGDAAPPAAEAASSAPAPAPHTLAPAVALFHSRSGSILAASDASDGSISGWTHSAADDDDDDDDLDMGGRAYAGTYSAATGLTHAGSGGSAVAAGPRASAHSSRGGVSARADARAASPARQSAARRHARIVRELKKRRAVALSVVLRAAGTWMETNVSDGALPGATVVGVGTLLSPEELTALVLEIGSVLTGVPPRMIATISAPGAQLPDDADAGMDGDEEERSDAAQPQRRRKRGTWRHGAARLALHTWQSSFPSFHAALLSYAGVDGAVANTQKAFLRDARTALGDWWTLVTALASSRVYTGSSSVRRTQQAGAPASRTGAEAQAPAAAGNTTGSVFPLRMVQRSDGSWAVHNSGAPAPVASGDDIRFHSSEGEREANGGWMMEDADAGMEITTMDAAGGAAAEADVTTSTIGQLERADMLGSDATAAVPAPAQDRVLVRAPHPPGGLGERDLSQTAVLNAVALSQLLSALPVRASSSRAAVAEEDDIWAEN